MTYQFQIFPFTVTAKLPVTKNMVLNLGRVSFKSRYLTPKATHLKVMQGVGVSTSA